MYLLKIRISKIDGKVWLDKVNDRYACLTRAFRNVVINIIIYVMGRFVSNVILRERLTIV